MPTEPRNIVFPGYPVKSSLPLWGISTLRFGLREVGQATKFLSGLVSFKLLQKIFEVIGSSIVFI